MCSSDLFVRERTGTGQLVDIAYLDSALALMSATRIIRDFVGEGINTARGIGALSGTFPYYGIYETRDKKYVSIGCTEPWLWKNLCQALGRPDLVESGMQANDFRSVESERQAWCRRELSQIFKTRDRDEWFDLLKAANVCVGKVYDVPEIFEDPQLLHRGMILPLQHPQLGEVLQIGIAIKLGETPGHVRGFAPWKGQHSDEVLTELGYNPEQILLLREKQII